MTRLHRTGLLVPFCPPEAIPGSVIITLLGNPNQILCQLKDAIASQYASQARQIERKARKYVRVVFGAMCGVTRR